MINLQNSVNGLTANDLATMLSVIAIDDSPRPKRKAELVNAIIGIFSDKQAVEKLLKKIKPLGRTALAEAAYNKEGYIDIAMFKAKYGALPDFYKPSERYSWREEKTVLGYFFFRRYLPVELQQLLQTLLPKPEVAQITPMQDALPDECIAYCSTAIAPQEYHAVLQLAIDGKLKVTDKNKAPTGATLAAIEKVLVKGDFYLDERQKELSKWDQKITPIRAYAWPYLLLADKRLKISGKQLVITAKGKQALTEPPEHVIKSMWDSWVMTKLVDEFNRINTIKGQTRAKRAFTPPEFRRTTIEAALQDLMPDAWYSIDAFSDYMQANHYQFEVIDAECWKLYICDPQYGQLSPTWPLVQLRYLLCVLFEYAATLGLLDIAYIRPHRARDHTDHWGVDDLEFISQYDGLQFINVNALGAYVLGLQDTYEPEPLDLSITIDQQGVVHFDGDVMPADLSIALNQFAEKCGEHQWKFTQKQLAVAFAKQGNFAALKTALKNHALALPAPINNVLCELEDNSKKVRFKERFLMFECQTEAIVDALLKIENVKGYAMRAGPKALAVSEKKQTLFLQTLQKHNIIITL